MGGKAGLKSAFNHHITDYKVDSVVHACVWECEYDGLIWKCLVWAERYTPGSVWVTSHRLSSATGEQK